MDDSIDIGPLVRKLGKDTLTYVPAKLAPGIINLLSLTVFTRIFDPGDYGCLLYTSDAADE